MMLRSSWYNAAQIRMHMLQINVIISQMTIMINSIVNYLHYYNTRVRNIYNDHFRQDFHYVRNNDQSRQSANVVAAVN